MKMPWNGRSLAATFLVMSAMVGFAEWAQSAEPSAPVGAEVRTVTGITQPEAQRKLVFPAQGNVREVMVKEGDAIKAGQVLAKLDDEADLAELARLKIDAESRARIEAAEADLKAKTLKYNRLIEAQKKGATTQGEVDEAEADMITRQKQLKVSQEEYEQAKLKYQQQKIRCDRMELKSTVDGFVQKINIGAGEFNDPQRQEGAIFVVQNNPLKIEIRELTTRQVATLNKGDKLQVRYMNDDPNAWQPAEVTFIAPMADAGSDTQLIQLSLANASNRTSGLHVAVKLTPEMMKAAPVDETALGQ
jgi:RND family efflux transporter MFP subunit